MSGREEETARKGKILREKQETVRLTEIEIDSVQLMNHFFVKNDFIGNGWYQKISRYNNKWTAISKSLIMRNASDTGYC